MDEYNLQQVCEQGHQITSFYDKESGSEFAQKFCDKCGEKTITQCKYCNAGIRGTYKDAWQEVSVPAYCHNCGKPYPWTENKIQVAIQIFAEFGNLGAEENKTIEQDIKNISRDIPQAELSALRIKKMWGKYGKIAYNVIMEFATKTAAEILKN